MKLLPRRWPRRLLFIYLLLVAVSLALVMHRPGVEEGRPDSESVQAMAGKGGTPGETGAFRFPGRWAEALLRLGLPLLDVYQPPLPALFDRRTLVDVVVRGVAGFQPSQPWTLLEAELPVLALTAGDGAGVRVRGAPPIPVPSADIPETPPSRPMTPSAAPQVIVYHTHAHESFLPELEAAGASPGGSPYTEDVNRNMVRVGEELARTLQDVYGIPVVHLRDLFDKDGLTGAYMESEKGVKAAMARYPTAKVLIDVHRDSAPREATTTVIDGRPVSRIMLVVGMGNEHLPNPHWQQNEAFAATVARVADALVTPDAVAGSDGDAPRRYPPLVRRMGGPGDPWTYGRDGRFNQHLSERAILVEIGGPGNTMAEELRAARLVARAVAQVIRVAAGE